MGGLDREKMTDVKAAETAPADIEAKRKTKCPDHVLRAIYGDIPNKSQQYDKSLHRCAHLSRQSCARRVCLRGPPLSTAVL
jgi:hypothetical protein